MKCREVLRELDLGNSVAEFDTALEKYFVETETFKKLIEGSIDVVAGDKGTGKTALFQILIRRYPQIEVMAKTEIVPGFNIAGAPIFQRLLEPGALTEAQYITVWKAYVLSLVGNWLLRVFEDGPTPRLEKVSALLDQVGLRTTDVEASTVFSKLINLLKRMLNPKSVGVNATFTEGGLPLVSASVELAEDGAEEPVTSIVMDEALSLLNEAIEELDIEIWIVLDRLDEAFQGSPDVEVPALRALLRTYLDLTAYPRLRLKLFVRKDLFRRIIGDGFVNLTHVNARKVEITWGSEDLYDLLGRRVGENSRFLDLLELEDTDHQGVFERLFPDQVDQGARKPKTWTWLIRRIRDGNDVLAPRNLIDLIEKAKSAQLRREEREEREFSPGVPLITADALKLGLSQLSSQRVEDTLLAEAGEAAALIEKFRGGKAEHNVESLSALLGVGNTELKNAIQSLTEIGFLEAVGVNFKIPPLYRDGLSITQGKAF